jgi:hypothetical protein
VGYTQKILRDINSKILYSYILDSLYKMKPDKYNHLPFTIKRETDSYDFLKENTFNSGCYIGIYKSLNTKFNIDSIELSKLKINKRILTNKCIDTKKYILVSTGEPDVILSEPIYFGSNNYVIIGTVIYSFLSGVHVFFKENNKWVYYNSYCITME